MQITKEDLYIKFTPKSVSDIDDFIKQFQEKAKEYELDNIILDLSNSNYTITDLLQLKNFSENKIELGTSFVVIFKEIDIDSLPDQLIVVPSFQEAVDMIEMDEMTRSLDF